jgi:hypothetical protein
VTGPGSTGVGPPQPITADSAEVSTTHLAGFARCALTSRSRSPSRAPKGDSGFALLYRIDDAEHLVTVVRVEHRADAYRHR